MFPLASQVDEGLSFGQCPDVSDLFTQTRPEGISPASYSLGTGGTWAA